MKLRFTFKISFCISVLSKWLLLPVEFLESITNSFGTFDGLPCFYAFLFKIDHESITHNDKRLRCITILSTFQCMQIHVYNASTRLLYDFMKLNLNLVIMKT